MVENGYFAIPILAPRTSPSTSVPRHQRPYPQQLVGVDRTFPNRLVICIPVSALARNMHCANISRNQTIPTDLGGEYCPWFTLGVCANARTSIPPPEHLPSACTSIGTASSAVKPAAPSRLSRPEARYRCCHRSVSSGRSPNPACPLLSTGLSTVSAAWLFSSRRPRAGNRVASVAVPGYRRCPRQIDQLDSIRSDWQPRPLRAEEPLTNVRPRPTMHCLEPHDHSSEEVLEHSECVLRDGMSKVVGPAVHNLIEPDQHVLEVCL